MLQIGEYVIDSTNGICRIEDIVKLDFAEDKNKQYYLLQPIKEIKAKVYISIDTTEKKIRKILTELEIKELLDDIKNIDSVWVENEKEREKIYRDAVRSCDPRVLVGTLKTLYFRNKKRLDEGKKNTIVDERYFKQAEDCLYSEIGFVLNLSNGEVKELIKANAKE